MKNGVILIVLLLAGALVSCVSTGGGNSGEPIVIRLKAIDAELTTEAELKYEEGPDNDNIGWWEETEDEISWKLEIAAGGEYTVLVSISCDPQFPGATVGVNVGEKKLTFVVPDTESWANYQIMEIGTMQLSPGSYTVLVKAEEVVARFVGNLRSVTFVKK